MTEQPHVIGIDLGTTNSEVAAFVGDRVGILGPGPTSMLPSCVGLSPAGELLVGRSARHQQMLYPERTVRSIKRRMGSDDRISLGDQTFSPQEISAVILRELVQWASDELGSPPQQAVITVPAYFSDAQRQATREAGALAGLEVLRILNEPTAASLAYGGDGAQPRTVLVYDLGGGTFDVSVVRLEDEVTEVLASHGNNQLGGDDFTSLLTDHLLGVFRKRHDVDLREGHPAAHARLWWAAEQAKVALTAEPFTVVREESLVEADGKPLHLEVELTRERYEDMVRPLLETTMDSVTRAMGDAKIAVADLDEIILVGGSTRTPLLQHMLGERSGLRPRHDVHPDLCVALGAGVYAARLSGREVDRVLVDVSPYTFGVSYLGDLDGQEYLHCFKPIIERNQALPVTRSERFFTCAPYQGEVDVEIFQGDELDALRNIPVGNFRVEELTETFDANEILCRMRLDLDGILNVSAIEKSTGKAKHVTIDSALTPKSPLEIAEARQRLATLYAQRGDGESAEIAELDQHPESSSSAPTVVVVTADADDAEASASDGAEAGADDSDGSRAQEQAAALLERSRGLLEQMHPEDQEEAIHLHERIESALATGSTEQLEAPLAELRELLFFVEGR